MLHRIRTRIFAPGSNGPWILASALLLALLVSPFAIAQSSNDGKTLRGGARNPSSDQRQAFTKETQIIANNSTYGTRQSNKSDNGGGAIYGCRSGLGGTLKNNEPCVRGDNLADGRAFEFNSQGKNATEVGAILAQNPNAAPFTTNAGGVATGLNADKVDGKNADDIVTTAQASNRFAVVSDTGVLTPGGRDAESATRTGTGTYNVTFKSDLSKCAYQATETTATLFGAAAVVPASAMTVTVHTNSDANLAADKPFHLTITC